MEWIIVMFLSAVWTHIHCKPSYILQNAKKLLWTLVFSRDVVINAASYQSSSFAILAFFVAKCSLRVGWFCNVTSYNNNSDGFLIKKIHFQYLDECRLMALFHCMVWYGTVRFTFGGVFTGYCTWYLVLF